MMRRLGFATKVMFIVFMSRRLYVHSAALALFSELAARGTASQRTLIVTI
jgi:hypothetical protein